MNTMQFEFDAVVKHLYTQGRQAKKEGFCAYRGENGTMCAVGCRIPDEMYKPSMDSAKEGGTINNMRVHHPEVPEEIKEYESMFWRLQQAHDSGAHTHRGFNFAILASDLQEIAEEFGLTFTEPQRPVNG